MDELHRTWSLNIRVARKRANLTQRALAEAIGVTQAAVARWETEVSIPTDVHKIAIAAALGQDVRLMFPLVRGI